ncbi:UNVERIFIED_CONTAM: hypothetical protein Sindi_1851200, partial [Sesamum indicum]
CINGWEGMELSYAGRIHIINSVLMAFNIYWCFTFLLRKEVIREIEKLLRPFSWKGTGNSGYAKLVWKDVCKPLWEGGQGLREVANLNRALMSKKLYDVVIGHPFGRIGCTTGDYETHQFGQFLRVEMLGGRENYYDCITTRTELLELSNVFREGQWHCPLVIDIECLEITQVLPQIHGGHDHIIWHFETGRLTAQAFYRLLEPPGPIGRDRDPSPPIFCVSQLLEGLYASHGLIETGHGTLTGQRENREGNTSSTWLTRLSLHHAFIAFGENET